MKVKIQDTILTIATILVFRHSWLIEENIQLTACAGFLSGAFTMICCWHWTGIGDLIEKTTEELKKEKDNG
jgi:hypothetical protein